MFIKKLALPRRTFLRGVGATVALPLLDAMVPAMKAAGPSVPRFAAIYCGMGANMFEWTPPTEGVGFELSPTLKPIEAFRNRTMVLSGLITFPARIRATSAGIIRARRRPS